MTDPEVEVRLLLRELSDVEPMPGEVADRLDETLARLSAARQVSPGPSRRRRLLVSGTVAASVIAVVGLGIGGVVHSLGTSATSSALAGALNDPAPIGTATPSDTAVIGEVSPPPLTDRGPSAAPASTPFSVDVPEGAQVKTGLEPPAFTSSDFASQARAWWPQASSYTAAAPCSGAWQSTAERALAARLDGRPAALVIFPAQGPSQEVEIFRCDTPGAAAGTVTLPAQ